MKKISKSDILDKEAEAQTKADLERLRSTPVAHWQPGKHCIVNGQTHLILGKWGEQLHTLNLSTGESEILYPHAFAGWRA